MGMDYRLMDRAFSRIWRRSKRYSDHEIKWLARKRGLATRSKGVFLTVYNPSTEATIVTFEQIKVREPDKGGARGSY